PSSSPIPSSCRTDLFGRCLSLDTGEVLRHAAGRAARPGPQLDRGWARARAANAGAPLPLGLSDLRGGADGGPPPSTGGGRCLVRQRLRGSKSRFALSRPRVRPAALRGGAVLRRRLVRPAHSPPRLR